MDDQEQPLAQTAPEIPPAERRQALLALLRSSLAADEPADIADEDDDALYRDLDVNRLSDRPLFPPEKKGLTG